MHQSSCASTVDASLRADLNMTYVPDMDLHSGSVRGQGRTFQTCINVVGLPLLPLTSEIDLLALLTTLPSADCWLWR